DHEGRSQGRPYAFRPRLRALRLSLGLPPGRLPLRDLLAFAACFREADGDRLFATFYFLLAPPASQRSLLALAHCAFDGLGSTPRIFPCHGSTFVPIKTQVRLALLPGNYQNDRSAEMLRRLHGVALHRNIDDLIDAH